MTAAFLLVALLQSQASNAELGYRFAVPQGFTPFPEARQQDVVDCWAEAAPAAGQGALVLCVHRMRGVLPREPMRQEDLPANTQLASFKWKAFDLSGLRTQTVQNGESVFVLVAQVPLRREAVQLSIGGPANQEARGKEILTATLATLDGETNWLSEADRSGRLGTIVGWVVGIAVALIIVRMWTARRRSQSG